MYVSPNSQIEIIPGQLFVENDRDMIHENTQCRGINFCFIHEFPAAVFFEPVGSAFHANQLNGVIADLYILLGIAQQPQSRIFKLIGQLLVIPVIDPFALMIAQYSITRCDPC